MLDGGLQERNIASSYNKWAEATKLEYPRTSAMLREIARSYESSAQTFDEHAEKHDWEY
jgi:hypothetical protein